MIAAGEFIVIKVELFGIVILIVIQHIMEVVFLVGITAQFKIALLMITYLFVTEVAYLIMEV